MRYRTPVIAVQVVVLVLASVLLPAACRRTPAGSGDAGARAPEPVSSAEAAAWESARPVIAEYCMKCHTATGREANPTALKHVSFDTYPPGGMHGSEAGSAVLIVLGLTGQPATMPADRPGSVSADALEKVQAWAAVFEEARRSPVAPAPPHHEH